MLRPAIDVRDVFETVCQRPQQLFLHSSRRKDGRPPPGYGSCRNGPWRPAQDLLLSSHFFQRSWSRGNRRRCPPIECSSHFTGDGPTRS
jgi:hypothetical protein